jgi:hypothetical protein
MIKTRDYKFTDEQMVRLLDVVRQVVLIDRCDIPESFTTSEFQHLKVKNENGHNDLDLYGDIVSQTLQIPGIF